MASVRRSDGPTVRRSDVRREGAAARIQAQRRGCLARREVAQQRQALSAAVTRAAALFRGRRQRAAYLAEQQRHQAGNEPATSDCANPLSHYLKKPKELQSRIFPCHQGNNDPNAQAFGGCDAAAGTAARPCGTGADAAGAQREDGRDRQDAGGQEAVCVRFVRGTLLLCVEQSPLWFRSQ